MNLGLLVKDLESSHLAYALCRSVNSYIGKQSQHDIIVFFENIHKPCMPLNFAIMQLVEAYSYNGSVVATNLELALKMNNFIGEKKKFLYLWDLEWLRRPYDVSVLKQLFKDVKVITRGPVHTEVFKHVWNVSPVAEIPDFDIKSLVEVTK